MRINSLARSQHLLDGEGGGNAEQGEPEPHAAISAIVRGGFGEMSAEQIDRAEGNRLQEADKPSRSQHG